MSSTTNTNQGPQGGKGTNGNGSKKKRPMSFTVPPQVAPTAPAAPTTRARARRSGVVSVSGKTVVSGEAREARETAVDHELRALIEACALLKVGEFSARFSSTQPSPMRELAAVFNEVATMMEANSREFEKMALEIEGRPGRGEFLRIGQTVNTMVDQLRSFASEVTCVAREVGREGQLGRQAIAPGAAGTWKDLTDSVNYMASIHPDDGAILIIEHDTTSARVLLDMARERGFKGIVATNADGGVALAYRLCPKASACATTPTSASCSWTS